MDATTPKTEPSKHRGMIQAFGLAFLGLAATFLVWSSLGSRVSVGLGVVIMILLRRGDHLRVSNRVMFTAIAVVAGLFLLKGFAWELLFSVVGGALFILLWVKWPRNTQHVDADQ